MRLTSRQLGGLSRISAELMGKPHIGAHYENSSVNSHRKDENARCAICGMRATEAHHVVPKGKTLGFTVNTPLGAFSCKTPLFALCRRCHEKFHKHEYEVEWCWNTEQYEEEWWDGHTLAHICRPHSEFLYQEGYYLFRDKTRNEERTIRP